MQKLLDHIRSCLLSEAWNGARLDEASKLVVEYCYQSPKPIDLVVRDLDKTPLGIVDVAFVPSIGRVFVLTQYTVFVLTDDFIFVAKREISFRATAIAFDQLHRRLFLLRSNLLSAPPHHSIVTIDGAVSNQPTFSQFEVGREAALQVDATNGDLYVFSGGRNGSILSRFSDGAVLQKRVDEYAVYWSLCAHDGVGALLVHPDKLSVRIDRNLSVLPTTSIGTFRPRYVSWTLNLVFSDYIAPNLLLVSNVSGAPQRIAVTPFAAYFVVPMSNGVIYFTRNLHKSVQIGEPCFFELERTVHIDS